MHIIAKIAATLAIVLLLAEARADARIYGPDADGDVVVLTQDDCTLPIKGAPVRLAHATLTQKDGIEHAGCWAMASDGVRILWAPTAPTKGWRVNPALFRKVSLL